MLSHYVWLLTIDFDGLTTFAKCAQKHAWLWVPWGVSAEGHSLLSQPQNKFKALTQPRFDYRSPVWRGLCNHLNDKLQKLQKRAARVSLKASYEVSSSSLLEILKWNQLTVIREKTKSWRQCTCGDYSASEPQTMNCLIPSVNWLCQ